MDQSLDYILAIAGVIIGIMMITGHGAVFMKGSNQAKRQQIYDEKKVEKVCGWGILLLGIVTGIDAFTTVLAAKIAYLVAIFVIFIGVVALIRKKCKK